MSPHTSFENTLCAPRCAQTLPWPGIKVLGNILAKLSTRGQFCPLVIVVEKCVGIVLRNRLKLSGQSAGI